MRVSTQKRPPQQLVHRRRAASQIAPSARTGRPLSPDARAAMEARFGYDFSAVRVHTESHAAAELGAKAVTSGRHIWFRPGRGPSDPVLLAHEIEHVVQQATGETDGLRGETGDPTRRETLERRAESQGTREAREAREPTRPLPEPPVAAAVLQFDFEEDVIGELRRLPSAETERLPPAERRKRAKVILERRARLRALFRDLLARDARKAVEIRERLRERRPNDLLSERFHDILATATRRELIDMLEGAFFIRVPPAAEFCKPFTQEELDQGLDLEIGRDIEEFVNDDIRMFYGDETADLWEAYVTRVPGDDLSPTIFDVPSGEIVQAFAKHAATRDRQRQLIEAIERTLSRSCPSLPPGRWVDISIASLLSQDQRNAPFAFEGVTTITGLIAGGVSGSAAGQDSRSVSGTVSLLRTSVVGVTTSVRMRTHLRFVVRDTIDFCPGGMGGLLARFWTVPLSRLEASGLAFDVPFEVHYDAPNLDVELRRSVATSCF